jgi:hypothetical protein
LTLARPASPSGELVRESMRAVVEVIAAPADLASLADDWEVLQKLHHRRPAYRQRIRRQGWPHTAE